MATKGKAVGASLAAVLALACGPVAYHEGYVPHTYADPVGVPTICFGHTGPDVTPGRVETRETCAELLRGDLAHHYTMLLRCVRAELPPETWAALTSWTYNVGSRAACTSTLVRMANAGAAPAEFCPQLDRWIYAGGRVWPGLVKRRAAERAMCEGRA